MRMDGGPLNAQYNTTNFWLFKIPSLSLLRNAHLNNFEMGKWECRKWYFLLHTYIDTFIKDKVLF